MKARALLKEAGLPERGVLIEQAAEYLRRTRRGRRYGLIGGLVVGFGPLAGDSEILLWLPRMLAGYMLGLLVSEWLVPRGERPACRAADLRTRRTADLLPWWWRAAIWIAFIPALSSPLLLLAHPAPGLTHVSTYGYTCDALGTPVPGWPMLTAVAGIGAVGLVAAELTLSRLARRRRPVDDLDMARLDDVLRGLSARAVAGGALALALLLAAGVGSTGQMLAGSKLCTAQPGPLVPAYPWAVSLQPWFGGATLVLVGAAVLVLVSCRRRDAPLVLPGPARWS
jgi:hypothetical protein